MGDKLWCVRLSSGEVLLKDGAFTDPGNCMMREYGAVTCIPELFTRKRDAKLRAARHGYCAGAVEYTWARNPWEREGSIVRVACNLVYDAPASPASQRGRG